MKKKKIVNRKDGWGEGDFFSCTMENKDPDTSSKISTV